MKSSDKSTYREHWLLAYDIKSTNQRSKLQRALTKIAVTRQKSFFEIHASEEQMSEIALLAHSCINEESDKLLIACSTKTLNTYRLGNNKPINLAGLWVIS